VRIPIIFARLVMLVIGVKRSKGLEPLIDILNQPALIIVHVDAGRDVHGGNKNHSVLDSRLLERTLDLRREVDVSAFRFGMQRDVFGVKFHVPRIITERQFLTVAFDPGQGQIRVAHLMTSDDAISDV